MRDLLARAAPPDAALESVGLGNGLTARAFLFGLSVGDLDREILRAFGPALSSSGGRPGTAAS